MSISIDLSTCTFLCLSIYLSTYLPTYLSIYLSNMTTKAAVKSGEEQAAGTQNKGFNALLRAEPPPPLHPSRPPIPLAHYHRLTARIPFSHSQPESQHGRPSFIHALTQRRTHAHACASIGPPPIWGRAGAGTLVLAWAESACPVPFGLTWRNETVLSPCPATIPHARTHAHAFPRACMHAPHPLP
jgi:hypothetical protein